MRKLITASVLAALAAGLGCRKTESAPTVPAAVSSGALAGYHFVGTAALANNTSAAKLREIWALPETRRFEEQSLRKLARAPKVLYDRLSAEQEERGAALLRPLLDDLIRSESFLQVRGPATRQAEWTLLVQLPPDRLKAWSTTLTELTGLWDLGAPTPGALDGLAASEIKRSSAPNLLQWLEAGSWFVLAVGQDTLPAVAEAVRRIKAGGRPIPATTNWLEVELNLPRLVGTLELSHAIQWPHAKLTVAGDGENLRTKMRMVFAEPVTGSLDPWQIPTNIINDPLISFTAVRGIAPWLKRCALLQQLELSPAPNELYFWAQGQITLQSFVAFPLKDAAVKLERATHRAPSLFGTNLQSRGISQVFWQTNIQEVSWGRLPFATPFLKPMSFKGRELVFGGLFPPSPLTNPPPAELLSQLSGRPKLVYYDWEITQARLASWRIMAQLIATIAGKSQFMTNAAALPWMMAAEPKLGNSATEITADSPSEWSLVRKSHLGFTGIELVALARWLESTNFPKLSFELPPERPVQAAAIPRSRPGTLPAAPAGKPPGN